MLWGRSDWNCITRMPRRFSLKSSLDIENLRVPFGNFRWPSLCDATPVRTPLVMDGSVAMVDHGHRRELPSAVVQVPRLVSCVLGNLRANSVADYLRLLGGHVNCRAVTWCSHLHAMPPHAS